MKKVALLVVFLVALLALACGKQEQAQSPDTKQTAETATAAQEQESAAMTAPGEQAAPETATQPEAAATMVDQMKEAAQAPAEAVPPMVESGKEIVADAASTLEDTAAAVEQKAMENVAEGTQAVAETAMAAGAAIAPESVVIKASYGDVTLPHKMHADNFACTVCHGEGTPGALELGKEKAHSLCKGCHAEKGAGPTKCTACHVKS